MISQALKSLLLSIPAVLFLCQPALFFAFQCNGKAYASVSETVGPASWYSAECCKYNPQKSCPMANGESLFAAEKAGEDFAAAWNYPLGQKLRVTNLSNQKSVIVTIKDRGPAKRLKRVIDLSKKSFSQIANLKSGIINVKVEAL